MSYRENIIDCPLTGEEVRSSTSSNTLSYDLTIERNTVEIFFCHGCMSKIGNLGDYQYIFKGLIANKKFPERAFIRHKECTNNNPPRDSETIFLPEYLEIAQYPKTPKDKSEHFFLNLFKRQKEDGESQKIDLNDKKIWINNFFKSPSECNFHFQGLKDKGWIKQQDKDSFLITHLGLNAIIELQNEGNNSNKCFIAMAFDNEMNEYRNAIKSALNKTKFEPIIIDEEHLASDKTIPDGILSGIKQAKFCLSDFTLNKAGVYFESGYALGLGKPVIYLCREEDFKNVHFDVKQLQHIIYKDDKDLEKKLVAKIEAWIKE